MHCPNRVVLFFFLQRKESKTQDKSITNGESFEKAKHRSRSCSGIRGASPSCRLRNIPSSGFTASCPHTASPSWPNTDRCRCVSSRVLPVLRPSPSCTRGFTSALFVCSGWRLGEHSQSPSPVPASPLPCSWVAAKRDGEQK